LKFEIFSYLFIKNMKNNNKFLLESIKGKYLAGIITENEYESQMDRLMRQISDDLKKTSQYEEERDEYYLLESGNKKNTDESSNSINESDFK